MSYLNVLLISEDSVKTYSNLNDSLFGKWLLPAIREAQEMGLMPIIGECLYDKICELVRDGSISYDENIAYKDLLDEKIQPYLIYKTLSNIIPVINVKLSNIGSVLTNDEHIVNLTQGESDLIKNYYEERADFYTKRLQDWVKSNMDAFPELNCGCDKMKPNLDSSTNTVSIWLGGKRGKMYADGSCGCSSSQSSGGGDYEEGYRDGYSAGESHQKSLLVATAVTQNGVYTKEDGYNSLTVDVPQTGHTEEEIEEAYESGYTSGATHQKSLLTSLVANQNGSYEMENGYSAVTVNVPTGSTINNQDKSITITANTATTVTFDSGYSGLGNVGINVNVHSSGTEILLTGNTSLNQFGRYYFDYDANTSINNITINFVKIPSNYIKFELIDPESYASINGSINEIDEHSFEVNFYYSYDEINWEYFDIRNMIPIDLDSEHPYVYLRGVNYYLNDGSQSFNFIISGGVSVSGNIMGLLNYNNPGLEIPETYCFRKLFNNCDIVDASGLMLPATSLTDYCYSYMFSGCTSLVSAPSILPATDLCDCCYEHMFYGCTALTSAPELPATTLVGDCYSGLFEGCRSLYRIKCLATDISASSSYGCTSNWAVGVPESSSGVFIKNPNMNDWSRGANGIPNNWMVQDA